MVVVPKWPNFEYNQNSNSQLSNAICAQILPTELQDQHQPIYWVPVPVNPVNGSSKYFFTYVCTYFFMVNNNVEVHF